MSKRWISVCALAVVLVAAGCSSSNSKTLPSVSTTTTTGSAATTSTTALTAGACPSDAARERELGEGSRTAAIQMVSAQRGFAVVARAVVGTVDGRHWSRLYLAAEDLSYVDAVDSLHVWAVGTHSLFASTDGGGHWIATATPTRFRLVHFVNAARGWAVGNGSLFETFDGGQSWQNASAPCPVDRACFADSLHGWAASRTAAFVTVDGGAQWLRRLKVNDSNFANASALDMQCTPTNAVWILFDSNNPAAGSDGYAGYRCPPTGSCGLVVQNFLANAQPDTSGPGSTPGPFSVIDEHTAAFVGYTGPVKNPTSIEVVGNDGRERGPVSRVVDGPPQQATPQSVSFVSRDRGWLVDGYIVGSHILGTADGGKTWAVEYQAPNP
jgi:hypothetical protein